MTGFGKKQPDPAGKPQSAEAHAKAFDPIQMLKAANSSTPQPAVSTSLVNPADTFAASNVITFEKGRRGQLRILKIARQWPPHLAGYMETLLARFFEFMEIRQFSKLSEEDLRSQIKEFVAEYSRLHRPTVSQSECGVLSEAIYEEMLGLGPLEVLLKRDDISDIMVNGPDNVFIETGGKIRKTDVKFRDPQHLVAICQRIATRVGRRADESSPICDARLSDGSRVNIILPPLSIDGATLTIRKFAKEKLTIDKLVSFGTLNENCATFLKIMSACRVNILVSGGTGSGKTTMLNCLTRYIDEDERIVTCEDAAELQLQQPHVVRLETRPNNMEGQGEVTMRDLVKNCLRMRPERIIVGEVRGPEAFDLLQAMNTGHDGSMGTLHANTPRDALTRMENMVAMANLNIPAARIREQIASAVNVIVQVQRLRDGSRKVTHVTEITGMEGEVVTMQDLFHFEIHGEDQNGKILGLLKPTGLRPRFYAKACEYGLENLLIELLNPAHYIEPDALAETGE